MKELILALMLAASEMTGLPNTDVLPAVAFMPEPVMAERIYGRPLPLKRHKFLGMYQCIGKRLFLPDTWDEDDPGNVATLFHELVHHLQCVEWGVFGMVHCDAEHMAYKAQKEWLELRGLDFYLVFNLSKDRFDGWLEKNCGRSR